MDRRWAGKEPELNRLVLEATRSGHRIVTADELRDIGLTRTMIRSRVNAGRLVPVLNRVYALPGTTLETKGRFRAAACAAGPNVLVSHASALVLYGMAREFGPVHLLGLAGAFRVGGERKWRSSLFGFGVECHQTRSLPDEHRCLIDGIRVTSPERALRDYAALASPTQLTHAITQGEKERAFCWKTLRSILNASTGHRGTGALLSVMDHWEPAFADTGSEPELDFLLMVQRNGYPMPAVNVRVGSYVPDFLWIHLNLAVELDPYGTHKGKAAHRQDHRKGIELEASGLRVIRFTWEDLYLHEERTADELGKILTHQATLLGQPLFPPPRPR